VLGPEALIGIDQEGGAVVRATFLPQPPSAMALGGQRRRRARRGVGAAVARGLKSLGINWNFAPVLDVNNNPANPVIGERSFSSDPDEVSRLAAGLDARLAGRGRGLLRQALPRPWRHACRLAPRAAHRGQEPRRAGRAGAAPFKALAAQAPAMMTAHIVYPQIDPDAPPRCRPSCWAASCAATGAMTASSSPTR
jgi:beta-N-acetylhexosaminidase